VTLTSRAACAFAWLRVGTSQNAWTKTGPGDRICRVQFFNSAAVTGWPVYLGTNLTASTPMKRLPGHSCVLL
jgi:hypothetical protein